MVGLKASPDYRSPERLQREEDCHRPGAEVRLRDRTGIKRFSLQNGLKKPAALDLATELTAILLGLQQIGREDYYRYRKKIPAEALTMMCKAIAERKFWPETQSPRMICKTSTKTGDDRIEPLHRYSCPSDGILSQPTFCEGLMQNFGSHSGG